MIEIIAVFDKAQELLDTTAECYDKAEITDWSLTQDGKYIGLEMYPEKFHYISIGFGDVAMYAGVSIYGRDGTRKGVEKYAGGYLEFTTAEEYKEFLCECLREAKEKRLIGSD